MAERHAKKPKKKVKDLQSRKLTAESAKAVRGGIQHKHLAGVKYDDITVSNPSTKPS
jgi:hypothetical protein